MDRSTGVVIDYVRGEALLGGTAVAIADAGARGQLQVGGPEGPVIRPLTFGERTRTVARAVASSRPRENVCVGVLLMATVRPGVVDPTVQGILALALAGAGQAAPPFAEAALMVARSTGWEHAKLEDAEAAGIDRLAIHLGGRQGEPQWNRLLLAKEPAGELERLRAELADDLLKRANPLAGTPENQQGHKGISERIGDDSGAGPSRLWNAGAASSPGGYGKIDPSEEEYRRSLPSEPTARPLEEGIRHDPRYDVWPDHVSTLGKTELGRNSERILEGPSIPARTEPVSPEQAATRPRLTWRIRLNNAGAPAAVPLVYPPSSAPEGPQPSLHSASTTLDGGVTVPPPPAVPDGDAHGVEARMEVMPPGHTTQQYEARSELWGFSEEPPPIEGVATLTEFADALATLLQDEADMRGID